MSLSHDVRSAVRSLQRNPSTTILAVLTLALAIGAATAMFSAVNGILLHPLPYRDQERIVQLSPRTGPDAAVDQTSWPNYEDLRDQTETVATAAAYSRAGMFVFPGGEPELVYGLDATHEFFDVVGVEPIIGRRFTAEEDAAGGPTVLVVSWEFWRSRLGGDRAAVGRPLQISSSGTTAEVIGVMPKGFRFPYDDRDVHFYAPMRPALTEEDRGQRGRIWLEVIARLAPGVTVEAANAELETLSMRLEQEYLASNRDLRFRAYPIFNEIVKKVERPLWVLLAAVGTVLLIACANVANLLLARAAARTREIALRSAIGASRWRVIRQLLVESLVIGIAGGMVGLGIGAAGLQLLVKIAPRDIPRLDTVALDLRVVAFSLAVALATGILFGLAPALLAARGNARSALQESTRGATENRGRGRLREALVVAEISLALLLLPAAGLLLRSFWNLTAVHPGYDDRNVTVLDLSFLPRFESDAEIMQAFELTRERLRAIPGVESVGSSRALPHFQDGWIEEFLIAGRPAPEPGLLPISAFAVVSPGYFETLRIPLLRGRTFTALDSGDSPEVTIISEAFAQQHFRGEDPIGRKVAIPDGPEREIIGVVGNILGEDVTSDPNPVMYVAFAQNVLRRTRYLVRTAPGVGPIDSQIRAAVRELDPAQPIVELKGLESYRADQLAARRLALWLLLGLASLAFSLAAVGIYSVMSYIVSQRSAEIGVRMAFGAEPRDIFRLVLKRVGALLAIGAVLGLIGAFASTRLVARFLWGLSPNDPSTFAAMLLILTTVALLAGWLPARRAARVDPLVAIRHQ